jgi:hypothetical protein
MRNIRHQWIMTLVLLSAASAVAQQPASHSATVAILAILKLRLHTSVATQAEVPIAIEVRDGVYTISPAATELHILDNSGWQLSASYTQSASQSTVQLLGRVAGEWRTF